MREFCVVHMIIRISTNNVQRYLINTNKILKHTQKKSYKKKSNKLLTEKRNHSKLFFLINPHLTKRKITTIGCLNIKTSLVYR